jgi:SAM-dependent methyltransferase
VEDFAAGRGWLRRWRSLIPPEKTFEHAAEYYRPTLLARIEAAGARTILELGAGRRAMFEWAELPECVESYTLNDISQEELELVPSHYGTARFDVCGDVSAFAGRFDFAFSRMLAEHVKDGSAFHANVFELLRPGGIVFHFLPILFAPPFVINRLLPESISNRVVAWLVPDRDRVVEPKFPAYYSMCSAGALRRGGRKLGFEIEEIRVFYSHNYFSSVPVVRELDHLAAAAACALDLQVMGAFAYAVMRKPA